MSLGVDTTALGLSFLINLIFSRIHELEGLPEDTFPDRGQTTQTAVILCVRVCVRACVSGGEMRLAILNTVLSNKLDKVTFCWMMRRSQTSKDPM